MIQKRHILIFAIPGAIILVLILALVVFELRKPKIANSPMTNPEKTSTGSQVDPQKKNEIPLYTQFGEPLILSLYSNPTTGFQWSANFDTDFFKLTNSFYRAKGDEKLVGSGGTQYFEFEILKEGRSDIRFEYKRPWEYDVSPEQVTIYKINVSGAPV